MKLINKSIISLVAFTLMSFSLFAQGGVNTSSMLIDAVQSYESGDYDKAETLLKAIITVDDSNDAAHYYLGLCLFYNRKLDQSLLEIKTAASLDPENYWYQDRLGSLYSMLGETDNAVQVYEDLVANHPKKVDLYYRLLSFYAQTERFEDVLNCLNEIEKMTGKAENTTLARYEIMLRLDRAEDAFQILSDYNELYSSPQILSMMGDSKSAFSEDSLALAYYEEALALEPDYAPALFGKIDIFRMRRDQKSYFSILNQFLTADNVSSESKSEVFNSFLNQIDPRFANTYKTQLDSLFNNAVQTYPADSALANISGTYFFRSNNSVRALEIFKQVRETYPDDFAAHATYVQALGLSSDWAGLRKAADEAFQVFPEEPAFINMMISADYNMNDLNGVISDSQKMIEAFPDDKETIVSSYSTIADIYYMMGQEKLAFSYYDRVIKLDPENCPALNNYAYYLSLKKKKLNKAYRMSKITVEQEPDNATYLDTFAWILHLQKKDVEAKSFFKHAMLYGGMDSATILDHYGDVLYVLKEYDLARKYWNQAKSKDTDNELKGIDEKIENSLKRSE